MYFNIHQKLTNNFAMTYICFAWLSVETYVYPTTVSMWGHFLTSIHHFTTSNQMDSSIQT